MATFIDDSIQYLPLLLQGAWVSIQVMLLSLALATVLGMVLALMRLSPMALLHVPAIVIITVLRGIPIFVQLLYIYFVFPDIGINLTAFQAAVIGIGIGYCAYHAENFRAGIMAIDRGQYEAAKSIGMRTPMIMRRIILPQAIRIILPPYGNIMIMMLKDSSLASVITVSEMTRAGQLIASSTFKNMTVFTNVAILYLCMSLPISALSAWLERRFKEK
jgi:polar amino acid transport system permease protein